jgi:diacylglycerol kinase
MRHHYGNVLKSFSYALCGIRTALHYEANMRIHTVCAILAVSYGLWIKLSATEWIALSLTISLVLFAELINTALEANVDLVTKEHRPEAKLAKDVAAGAVLITSVNALVVGWLLFGNHFLK